MRASPTRSAYLSGKSETCTAWQISPIGALSQLLFGYRRTILSRNALVAQAGSSRCDTDPQDARCWNSPRLSWSTVSETFWIVVSTIVVVIAMTAARSAMPRCSTALTTARAQDTR